MAYFDPVNQRSLSSRVCQNDKGLHISSSQALLYIDLRSYVSDNPDTDLPLGFAMCCLSLLMWYFTCCAEIVATVALGRALYAVPRKAKTAIEVHDNGVHFKFVEFSRNRTLGSMGVRGHRILQPPNQQVAPRFCEPSRFGVLRLLAVVVRMAIAVTMLAIGTLFLAYNIDIKTLMFDTVVLALVMEIDEVEPPRAAAAACRAGGPSPESGRPIRRRRSAPAEPHTIETTRLG